MALVQIYPRKAIVFLFVGVEDYFIFSPGAAKP